MKAKMHIRHREDIELLIQTFYEKVKTDERIGFIFNDVARVDWPKHLPLMCDFWESLLLHNPVYRGQVIPVHLALDKKVPLQQEHFTRWKQLFFKTLDELFVGAEVAEAKRRVELMEPLMRFKIEQDREE